MSPGEEVAFTEGGKIISIWGDYVRTWDGNYNYQPITDFEAIGVICISTDGSRVISQSDPIKIWDTATGELIQVLPYSGLTGDTVSHMTEESLLVNL